MISKWTKEVTQTLYIWWDIVLHGFLTVVSKFNILHFSELTKVRPSVIYLSTILPKQNHWKSQDLLWAHTKILENITLFGSPCSGFLVWGHTICIVSHIYKNLISSAWSTTCWWRGCTIRLSASFYPIWIKWRRLFGFGWHKYWATIFTNNWFSPSAPW